MRINHIIAASALAFSLLSSCNNSEKKGETENKTGGMFDSNDQKLSKANELIQFNNTLVKIDNRHYNDMNAFTETFDALEKHIKTKLENPAAISIPPIRRLNSLSIDKIEDLKYPEGTKDFKPLLDQMDESYKALLTISKDMESYKSAEDWKEDKGAKLKTFKEQAESEIKKNREASVKVFDQLKPLIDAAEEVTLANNPLKNQYIRSENILNTVLENTKQFFDTKDIAKVKPEFAKNYQEIEKLMNENKADKISDQYRSKAGSFERFNDAVNDYLGKMRILQRNLDEGTEFEESNLSAFEQASTHVLHSYNNFVD